MAFVAVLVVVWLVTTAVAVSLAWRALNAAEEDLTEARRLLGEVEILAARDALLDADDELGRAAGWLAFPTVRVAQWLPGFGTSIGVSRDLTDAVGEVTGVGAAALTALAGDGGLEAFAPVDGRLPVAAIADLGPALTLAAEALSTAAEVAFEAPATGLARPVADARDKLLETLPEAAEQARRAALLTEHLPAFLGADGPREYLLGAANPAELRGTGGYVGAVTTVTFDRGGLTFGRFTPTYDLPPADGADLPAPPPDLDRYTPFGGTISWQNLNLTPDGPTAARGYEQLWAATHPGSLDGTIIVDPFALEALLSLTGPVEVPGIERAMTAENVVRFVANEAYALFDEQDVRQEILGEVAGVALDRLLSSPPRDTGRLVRELGTLLAERHLILHAADPDEQSAFEALGVTGSLLDPVGDYLAVILNSATASKVDFWARRNLTYDVRLLDGGAAAAELEVTITNDAPRTGARRVVGPNNPALEAGDNLLFVSTYCATSCRFTGGPDSDLGPDSALTQELGHPVWGSWHHIPSRDETTFRYAWETGSAWWPEGDAIHYRLTYQHQTMVRGTNVTVRLALPSGFSVVELPRNATVSNGVLTWENFLRADAVLDVRLERNGA